MIPQFRNMASIQPACQLDGLIDSTGRIARDEEAPAEGDREFEVLLKHALSDAPAQADGGRVWRQIARKMRGPFGSPALEGPGCTTFEQVLMSSGGRVLLAPFVFGSPEHGEQPDGPKGSECVWEMLRCVSTMSAPKGYSWLFS